LATCAGIGHQASLRPGEGVGGLDVALEKAKAELQYIQVRHEEMPTFIALPPHITMKDAKNFMTLTEPELGSVLKNSAKQLLSSVLPGGKE
jgi:hypothetical protein